MGQLAPNSERTIPFLSDEGGLMMVELRGDGTTDLDLIVRDKKDKLVCESRNHGDKEGCRWYASKREIFSAVITNLGDKPNLFQLKKSQGKM